MGRGLSQYSEKSLDMLVTLPNATTLLTDCQTAIRTAVSEAEKWSLSSILFRALFSAVLLTVLLIIIDHLSKSCDVHPYGMRYTDRQLNNYSVKELVLLIQKAQEEIKGRVPDLEAALSIAIGINVSIAPELGAENVEAPEVLRDREAEKNIRDSSASQPLLAGKKESDEFVEV